MFFDKACEIQELGHETQLFWTSSTLNKSTAKVLLIKHNRYLWMTHSPTTVKPHRLFCWVWQSQAHGWWTAVKSSWRMMEAGWRPVVCHTPLSPIKKEQKKHARLELHTKYCEKFVKKSIVKKIHKRLYVCAFNIFCTTDEMEMKETKKRCASWPICDPSRIFKLYF